MRRDKIHSLIYSVVPEIWHGCIIHPVQLFSVQHSQSWMIHVVCHNRKCYDYFFMSVLQKEDSLLQREFVIRCFMFKCY